MITCISMYEQNCTLILHITTNCDNLVTANLSTVLNPTKKDKEKKWNGTICDPK